jgi:hypothetical protein
LHFIISETLFSVEEQEQEESLVANYSKMAFWLHLQTKKNLQTGNCTSIKDFHTETW